MYEERNFPRVCILLLAIVLGICIWAEVTQAQTTTRVITDGTNTTIITTDERGQDTYTHCITNGEVTHCW